MTARSGSAMRSLGFVTGCPSISIESGPVVPGQRRAPRERGPLHTGHSRHALERARGGSPTSRPAPRSRSSSSTRSMRVAGSARSRRCASSGSSRPAPTSSASVSAVWIIVTRCSRRRSPRPGAAAASRRSSARRSDPSATRAAPAPALPASPRPAPRPDRTPAAASRRRPRRGAESRGRRSALKTFTMPNASADAGHASNQRERSAFDRHLTEERHASDAERAADGVLLLTAAVRGRAAAPRCCRRR